MKIELLYDTECPNVEEVRARLKQALKKVRLTSPINEWVIGQDDLPRHLCGFGSPSIFVSGKEITGSKPTHDQCCRIYEGEKGLEKTPPVEVIVSAIKKAQIDSKKTAWSWGSIIAAFPSIGIAFIPGVTCPACWPAYTALFSALGIPFFELSPSIMLPLTITAFFLALFTMGFRAKRRWGYGPFGLGVIAFVLYMFGKFSVDSSPLSYVAISLLIGAAIWNAWPSKQISKVCCMPSNKNK